GERVRLAGGRPGSLRGPCSDACSTGSDGDLLTAAIAIDAARQQVLPFHGQPPVAWVSAVLLHSRLWPEMFYIDLRGRGKEALAVGALAVKQLVQRGLHCVVLVGFEILRRVAGPAPLSEKRARLG